MKPVCRGLDGKSGCGFGPEEATLYEVDEDRYVCVGCANGNMPKEVTPRAACLLHGCLRPKCSATTRWRFCSTEHQEQFLIGCIATTVKLPSAVGIDQAPAFPLPAARLTRCTVDTDGVDEIVVGDWLHLEAMDSRPEDGTVCYHLTIGERAFDVFIEKGGKVAAVEQD